MRIDRTSGVAALVALTMLLTEDTMARKKARAAQPPERGFVEKTYRDPNGEEHKFVLFVPHSYPGKEPFPVILFLHGAGEHEKGAKAPVDVGIGQAIKKLDEKEFPFFVIFPRARYREGPINGPYIRTVWSGREPNGQKALGMLDQVEKEYKTDPKRVYLTGLSMGGFGTWALAAEVPDRWAAIVPVCGGGDPKQADRIKHIPCWCFHGNADESVRVQLSREMMQALWAAGAKPGYTEYPGVGHNRWDRAYETKELYTWLLKQRLK
jgi:predicted peptidase